VNLVFSTFPQQQSGNTDFKASSRGQSIFWWTRRKS